MVISILQDITHAGGSVSDQPNGGDLGGEGTMEENIPGLGQYDDFHTIDWQRDIARDRTRHRYIVKKKQDSFMDVIRGAHDAWSGDLPELALDLTCFRLGVRPPGRPAERSHGGRDRHRCHLADGPQVWYLSLGLLSQHGAVLLVQQ